MADKQARQKAVHEISSSISIIASLGSNIQHYLSDIKDDAAALEIVSNRLAEELGQLRDIYAQMLNARIASLLPDSGVQFEQLGEFHLPKPELPAAGDGI